MSAVFFLALSCVFLALSIALRHRDYWDAFLWLSIVSLVLAVALTVGFL